MNSFFIEEIKIEDAIRCLVDHVPSREKSGKQKPIVAHSVRMAYHLLSLGYSEETAIIAILHDILENSSLKAAELESQFGPYVRQGVEALTVPSKTEVEWLESLMKCEKMGRDVMAVRVADLYDNIERQKLLHNWPKLEKYLKKLDYLMVRWSTPMSYEPIWRRILLSNGKDLKTVI